MDWRRFTRHSLALSLGQIACPDFEIVLHPGDALFIPPAWFYWTTSTSDEKDKMNVALNRLYKHSDEKYCIECAMAVKQDPPLFPDLKTTREPKSLQELHQLQNMNELALFAFRDRTLNIAEIIKSPLDVTVCQSSTNQFASDVVADVFPHLCQYKQSTLVDFFKEQDPHTILQCEIDGLDDVFGGSGSIPFQSQNLRVSFGENTELLNHCEPESNILLQIKGTQTIRLWRPCMRDHLLMRLPIATNILCYCRARSRGKVPLK